MEQSDLGNYDLGHKTSHKGIKRFLFYISTGILLITPLVVISLIPLTSVQALVIVLLSYSFYVSCFMINRRVMKSTHLP